MPRIDLETNLPSVLDVLDRLSDQLTDMSPAMAGIAQILEGASERAFAEQADPSTGEPWAALSETTLKLRPHREGGQILQDKGTLASSLVSDYGDDWAEIGTNLVYAPTHFFGAEQGAFGKSARGNPLPWGDIPARPFMGINAEDEEDMLDVLEALLLPDLPTA